MVDVIPAETPHVGNEYVGAPSADAPGEAFDNAALTFDHWGYRHASRRHFAVRGLNLTIEAGQRVLLLGASGIGKSTILEGAAGLLGGGDYVVGGAGGPDDVDHGPNTPLSVPKEGATSDRGGLGRETTHISSGMAEDAEGGVSEGAVLVDGVPVQQARGRVGLVLQDPDAQVIFQRLGDNLAFGPENLDVPKDDIWRRVRRSLRAVCLEGMQLERSALHLSGGQMQRLALAGALAMRPGVLLLDEPTANLDPDGVGQIVGAVQDVLDASHATMMLVEHRAEPWIGMIDRVIVLGLETDEQRSAHVGLQGDAEEVDRGGFKRTVVVADGTQREVFASRALDFEGLGIWLPARYRRPHDTIAPLRTGYEPAYPLTASTGHTLLSAEDLAVGRNGTAIAENINLAFATGQITALVGANGVGKSTLSLTLAGLLEPVRGEVVAAPDLQGSAAGPSPIAWKSGELAARISYVFQNPEHQFARGTVLEEVMLGPLRTGAGEAAAKAKAISLLERFKLGRYAQVNPYTLSGGEKRRLTVAAALAAAPRVLILDEPTFGQDLRTWMQIVELIRGLRGDGVSIIVVTHDRDLVTALGAKVVELTPDGHTGQWRGRDGAMGRRGVSGSVCPPDSADSTARRRASSRAWQSVHVSAVNERRDEPKQSSRSRVLASLNPASRLGGAFLASLPLLVSLDWVSATVALGLELVLLISLGLTPWRIVRSSWPIFIGAPGSALAVLLYGKSGGATWWQWGMIDITDRSATLAIATGVRILAIGIPAIIIVLGIDATDLADALSQLAHLPDRFVYGGLAGMRLFSVLQDDWAALTASRRSRGLGDENRFKAFFPQAFALLVLSIRRSTTLAAAMEARGFGGTGPRSHARISVMKPRDWVFMAVCLAVPLVAIAASVNTGSFAFFGG